MAASDRRWYQLHGGSRAMSTSCQHIPAPSPHRNVQAAWLDGDSSPENQPLSLRDSARHHAVAIDNRRGQQTRPAYGKHLSPHPAAPPNNPSSPSPRLRHSFLSSSLANLHQERVQRSPSLAQYKSQHHPHQRPHLSTEALNRSQQISETPVRISAMPEHHIQRLLARHALEAEESSSDTLNCVLVGEHDSGKTSLVNRYVLKDLPVGKYEPTVLDHYNVMLTIDEQPKQLRISDTGGLAKFSTFRRLSYANAHVFMLCFSVTQLTALRNIQDVWLPELRQHNPNTPIILVGMKADARLSKISIDGTPVAVVSADKASRLAKEQRVSYVECSSYTGVGLKQAFDEAIWQVVKQQRKAAAKKPGHSISHGRTIKQELKRALSRTTSSNPTASPATTQYFRHNRQQNQLSLAPTAVPMITPEMPAGAAADRFQPGDVGACAAAAAYPPHAGGQKKPSRKIVGKLRKMFRRNAASASSNDVELSYAAVKAPASAPSPKKKLLKMSHSMNV
eukprot:scpid25284/ scgid28538/ Rho-related GTP-binding protein RhoU; Rho GTPase-like protein ARHU; Wnt-1 responsive Cdc42 homolog 1